MALNYDKSGNSISIAAPETVISGQAIMLGGQVGIAQFDALVGEQCTFSLAGVWVVPSQGTTHDVGQPLNYDTSTGAFYVGAVAVDDWENVAMSFSPGGGALPTVQAKINTHLGTFAT